MPGRLALGEVERGAGEWEGVRHLRTRIAGDEADDRGEEQDSPIVRTEGIGRANR